VPQNVIINLRYNTTVPINGRSSLVGGREGICCICLPGDKPSVSKHVHVKILQNLY